MALTPQEIATGVLNPDRTVADVQAFRGSYLPYGAYESLLQQARRNEERMANNVTSSQIEADYGQQSRPDVSGLANREAPSYAAPKRQNVRPQRTGVVGGGRLRGKGSAGVPNEPVKTMTTDDGKGIITDGNLDKEMANANASPKSAPSVQNANGQTSSESEDDSSIIPMLIMSGLLGTAGVSAAKAFPKMLNAIDENAKAASAAYNKEIGYGESMNAKDMKNAKARASYAGNKAWNDTSPEEKARINEEHLQNYKAKVKAWKESGLSWDEFNAREAAARAGSATTPAASTAKAAPTVAEAWKPSPYKPVANPMGDLGELSAASKALKILGPVGAMLMAGKSVYDDTTDGEYHSEPDKLKKAADEGLGFLGLNSILPAEYQDPIRTLSYAFEDFFGIPHSAELEKFIKNKYDNIYNERKLINDITRNKSLFATDKQPDPEIFNDPEMRTLMRISQSFQNDGVKGDD